MTLVASSIIVIEVILLMMTLYQGQHKVNFSHISSIGNLMNVKDCCLCDTRSNGLSRHDLESHNISPSLKFLEKLHHIMLVITITGKGKVTLFNVGSSFSDETGINGSRRCTLHPPPLPPSVFRFTGI